MSDCLNSVYGDRHALALAATLRCLLERALCNGGANPTGLISQARRGSGEAEAIFFAECERIGLEVTLLSTVHLPASVGANDGAGGDGDSSVNVALHAVTMRHCT